MSVFAENRASPAAILSALDKFVSDFEGTGELERLEEILQEFNLFEALKAINSELKHSNFLSWVLDPNGSHGLGDFIVKRLLQRALVDRPPLAQLAPVNLDLMDLSDMEVRREWSDIDILLLSRTNTLSVAIENKISASEGRGQLEKYAKRIEAEFNTTPDGSWSKLFIYLTIDGETPSHDGYIAVSHEHVVDILESAVKHRASALKQGVQMTITHYIQMMRRHHMDDSELISLARKVYLKHRLALDYIFEHRPDEWSDAREKLLLHLNSLPDISVDRSTEKRLLIRFFPNAWQKWNAYLSQGTAWKGQGSDQFLLCEIKPATKRDKAKFQLVLGSGPLELRERIIAEIKNAGLYKYSHSPQFTTVLTKPWRSLQDMDGNSLAEKGADEIVQDVSDFLVADAPRFLAALDRAFVSL